MMSIQTIVLFHELLCAALFYSVFFRAVKTSERVRGDIRFAFFVLGSVACAGMAAPIAWSFVPDPFELALLAGVTLVQVVTTHHWRHGVPDRYYKPGTAPRNRRRSDAGVCHG